MDSDLPGFRREGIPPEPQNGCLTVAAAKGLGKDEAAKKGKAIMIEG